MGITAGDLAGDAAESQGSLADTLARYRLQLKLKTYRFVRAENATVQGHNDSSRAGDTSGPHTGATWSTRGELEDDAAFMVSSFFGVDLEAPELRAWLRGLALTDLRKLVEGATILDTFMDWLSDHGGGPSQSFG